MLLLIEGLVILNHRGSGEGPNSGKREEETEVPVSEEGAEEMEVLLPEGVAKRTPDLIDNVTGDDEMKIVPEGTMEVTKGKKHIIEVLEHMVSKRTRLQSQYIVSPYTIEIKKRMFMDSTLPNLFREVDLAKKKAFDVWFNKIGPE